MGAADESWTNKELQAECKRRGIVGYSGLNKALLLQALNTGRVVSGNGGGGGSSRNFDLAKMTVAELKEQCRRRGLRNFSRLRKDELIGLLRGGKESPSGGTKHGGSKKVPEPTLEELRAECRKRGMTGFSNLKKADLLRRMEDYESADKGNGAKAAGPGTQKKRGVRAILRREGKQRGERQQHRARMRGPLRSRAQTRFEAGPSPQDTPGFLYIYYEAGGGSADAVKEWKIGKTILDPPERRMHQSAQNNKKAYKLRASWYVPWCGYVEKIVHLDLDDFQVVPGKEKSWEGGGREDGGTEWFRTDIEVIEARVKLVIRMVAAREADEADLKGVPAFCGMFRCGLPKRFSKV
ncbi:unnamed protein product [Hapterophycus canaliculatus]